MGTITFLEFRFKMAAITTYRSIHGPSTLSLLSSVTGYIIILHKYMYVIPVTAVKPVVSMQWLGPHIDLRVPPPNWIRARSPVEKYIHDLLYNRGFRSHRASSFSMAAANLEQLNDADVISDAQVVA